MRRPPTPKQNGLGAIDIAVRRNGYGRQVDSSIREGKFRGSPIEMVFIRAPKIERVGNGVQILGSEGADQVDGGAGQGVGGNIVYRVALQPDRRLKGFERYRLVSTAM